jgi:hypothetical protein
VFAVSPITPRTHPRADQAQRSATRRRLLSIGVLRLRKRKLLAGSRWVGLSVPLSATQSVTWRPNFATLHASDVQLSDRDSTFEHVDARLLAR